MPGRRGTTPESSAAKVPYGEPSQPDVYERTTEARQECASCGEWIYPRRPVGKGGPFALPPNCDVCGAAT